MKGASFDIMNMKNQPSFDITNLHRDKTVEDQRGSREADVYYSQTAAVSQNPIDEAVDQLQIANANNAPNFNSAEFVAMENPHVLSSGELQSSALQSIHANPAAENQHLNKGASNALMMMDGMNEYEEEKSAEFAEKFD